MKIVLIGTGNVAVVLAKKLKAAGHTVVQVFGRNYSNAAALAVECGAAVCTEWDSITQDAGLYIIAVSDKALTDNTIPLKLTHQLVVHTAGAVAMERLKDISPSYGVLYPFQTIRKEIALLPDIPFMVDANSTAAKEELLALAKTISHKVILATDIQRMQYHLCAVITNNFSNYLYVLVENYCIKHGLDFSSLQPLIDETARRLHRYSPQQVQTGPAARKDMATIQHHQNLLQEEPALMQLYKIFSDKITNHSW